MLPRHHRLRHQADIETVRKHGRKIVTAACVILFLNSEQSASRFCFIAGRGIGNAVVRNRAKRRLRAIIHHKLHLFQSPVDVVLIARSRTAVMPFSVLKKKVMGMLKSGKLLSTPSITSSAHP